MLLFIKKLIQNEYFTSQKVIIWNLNKPNKKQEILNGSLITILKWMIKILNKIAGMFATKIIY